ncbi:hypothetical protein [Streptomyces similanensis]|uniref:Secreted protein/lipoprotein n=1 Tax=Streptomyces similanensis TaxID=1274988 RepID=A0ABP9LIL3_9ACTN
MGLTARARRTGASLAGAAVLAGLLAGCGQGDGNGKAKALPTPARSRDTIGATAPTPTNPEAVEKAAVLAAYDGMTTEQTKAYQKASKKGTRLEKYATLNALSKIDLDLYRMKEAGTVVRGGIGHDATVTRLDLKATIPTASLSDCVDLSTYQTYDVRAKKVIRLPSAQPLHYMATAKAERWSGRWLVTDIDTTQGGPC